MLIINPGALFPLKEISEENKAILTVSYGAFTAAVYNAICLKHD